MLKLSHLWIYGLFVIPFFSVSGTPFPYVYPKIFFIQLYSALGLALFIFENKNTEILIGRIFLSCFALLLLSFASSFYAVDMVAAFFGPFWRGTGVFFYFTCLLIWLNLNNSNFPKEKFAKLMVCTGGLIALVILFYRLTGQVSESRKILMGNPNALSLWLGGTLFINFLYRKSIAENKVLHFGVYAICFLAVIFLGSRSTLGGIIGGMILIGVFNSRKFLKGSTLGLGVTVIILAVIHFIQERSFLLSMIERSKQFHRKDIWLGAWDSFMAHPFLGYGFHGLIQGYWENFPSQIEQGISWNDNAHSLPLNIAGEMGLFGLLIFGLILFYFIKDLLIKEKDERAGFIGLGFFLSLYCLVQPFYIDTILFMIFVAFLFGDKAILRFSPRTKLWIASKSLFITALATITFLQIGQLKQINQTRRDIVANKNYRKTWNIFMEDFSLLDKPGALLEISNQMGGAFKGESKQLISLREPMISFMLDQYDRNFESFSNRPRMYENYANWLTRAQKYQQAIAVLDRSLKKSDQITKAHYQKASIYIKFKDFKNAKKMLLKVKELNPDFPQIEKYLGKLKNF